MRTVLCAAGPAAAAQTAAAETLVAEFKIDPANPSDDAYTLLFVLCEECDMSVVERFGRNCELRSDCVRRLLACDFANPGVRRWIEHQYR